MNDRVEPVDLPDQTWTAVNAAALSHEVVYYEHRIRDWRWLWLRRSTVTEIVSVRDLDA
jgi:hypothetical protein